MPSTPSLEESEGFRTTLTLPMQLVERIDDLLHEGKKDGRLLRNLKRNAFIIQLLEERVGELRAEKPAQKKR